MLTFACLQALYSAVLLKCLTYAGDFESIANILKLIAIMSELGA